MEKHGVNVSQQATSVSTPVVATSGVPFVIGVAPVQCADDPATPGIPVICTSFADAVKKLGYSDNWKDYTICEFIYSHFKLYGCQPVIFCNVLNPSEMKETAAAHDATVTDHKVMLPIEAINDENLIVKASEGSGEAYLKESDYSAYYHGENLVIETLSSSPCYEAEQLNVAYHKVSRQSVTNATVAAGLESIEQCLTLFGIVPDLICAPGFSSDTAVAAVMATKASGINGMFKAKALIDMNTASVKTYSDAIQSKRDSYLIDPDEIACWPMVKMENYQFHMSTHLAGLISQVDSGNGGCPYESPSNKNLRADSLVLKDGSPVHLTLAQANMLNANGIVTAIRFTGGWTCWGNYTACFPGNLDPKDYFIPVSRMVGWIGNSIIRTYWRKLDKPMNRRFIDTIKDAVNLWLAGLVGSEYLLGARVEFLSEENPDSNLAAGMIKFHVYITPPSPAQQIDFLLEYDVNYIASALQV